MRAESDWVTAVGIGRIQDKTRWTKALGEAVTFVYGDCTGAIGQSRRNSSGWSWKYRADFDATIGCDRVAKRNRDLANKT